MGQSYRDLIVWQRAMLWVREVYRATKMFPWDELYGLASQIRRAAVSVASNIAEGQARFSQRNSIISLPKPEALWPNSRPKSSSRMISNTSK